MQQAAITIPAGMSFSTVEQADGSVKLHIPEHLIRQAYCDLVYAEVQNRGSREPKRAMS